MRAHPSPKKSMMISFSETSGDHPDLPKGYSRLMTAQLDLSGPTPKLINEKKVYESADNGCSARGPGLLRRRQEDDLHLLRQQGRSPPALKRSANAMGIDLATGQVTNFSQAPGTYNECEGIFPDGKYAAIEGDRQVAELGGNHGWRNIDLWKLSSTGLGRILCA